MTRRGFTLIELLIVVAIIAILAAIAVPNFLEAQVRAKVSRVQAEMRSVSVAMEAYFVDHNRYPIPSDQDGREIPNPRTAVSVLPFETRLPITLTTPVAYLTSHMVDPFATHRLGESGVYHCITLDYITMRQLNAPRANWFRVWRDFYRELRGIDPPDQIRYYFTSFGPDKQHDADIPHAGGGPTGPHQHAPGSLYDPTNGTISAGDIYFFGPGFGFRP
jgi:prepilin-type N-terminal cleavage/methylation domain-containing protein